MERNRSCQFRQYRSNRCGSAEAPANSRSSEQATTPRKLMVCSRFPRRRRQGGTESEPRITLKTWVHLAKSPSKNLPPISKKIVFFASQILQSRVDVFVPTSLVFTDKSCGSTPEFRRMLVLPLPSGPISSRQGSRYMGSV